MSNFLTGLWNLGPWNWLIGATLLLIVEAAVPGMHVVWFGLAALIVGLLALWIPFAWQTQVMLFIATAIGLVVVARPLYKRALSGGAGADVSDRTAQYIGRTFEVADAIRGGRGRIRVGDTLWQAEGPDAPAGAHVRVVRSDGTLLIVEPVTG